MTLSESYGTIKIGRNSKPMSWTPELAEAAGAAKKARMYVVEEWDDPEMFYTYAQPVRDEPWDG